MARQIIAGIDIGTYEVKVMIAEANQEKVGASPFVLGTGQASSRGLRYGYIINRSDIEKSIREALLAAERQAKVKAKRTYLSIGGVSLESFISSGSVMISRADSEITEMDLDKCMSLAEESLRGSGALQN